MEVPNEAVGMEEWGVTESPVGATADLGKACGTRESSGARDNSPR